MKGGNAGDGSSGGYPSGGGPTSAPKVFGWKKTSASEPDPGIEGFEEGEVAPFAEVRLPSLRDVVREWVRPASGAPALASGDRIRVTGLEAELNGQEGTAVEFVFDGGGASVGSGRWRVIFRDCREERLLKAGNLEKWVARSKGFLDDLEPREPEPLASSAPPPEPAKAPAPKLNPGIAVKSILKSARPDWKDSDLSTVQAKLERVGITTGLELLLQLAAQEGQRLNAKLKSAGEKAFTAETLKAMWCPSALTSDKAKSAAEVGPMLPQREYQVVDSVAFVREKPDPKATTLRTLKRGERLTAIVETFSGWVRLAEEAGWVVKSQPATSGATGRPVLLPLGTKLPEMAQAAVTGGNGGATFEVVYKHVGVRASPIRTAMMLELKQCGELVFADVQSYNGWVHLVEEDGWMLQSTKDLGRLLRCVNSVQEPDSEPDLVG